MEHNKDGQRSPRILFLADRNILADQAFNAFSAFEEDALVRINPSDIKKKGESAKKWKCVFYHFPNIYEWTNDTPYFGEYPNDFFDFIIMTNVIVAEPMTKAVGVQLWSISTSRSVRC